MRHFSRRHRCIVFSARGYPPSDVPDDLEHYSQAIATRDILDVLDHLAIERAHIVGLSMGGFATLHFGLSHPDRALSPVVAGAGYGAERRTRHTFATSRWKWPGSSKPREPRVRPDLCTGSLAHRLPAERPARLAGVRGQAGRALRAGSAMTHARRTSAQALALRPRRPLAADGVPAGHGGRRRRSLPAARPVPEASRPGQRRSHPAQVRPRSTWKNPRCSTCWSRTSSPRSNRAGGCRAIPARSPPKSWKHRERLPCPARQRLRE